jgi:hypothetical protein
MLADMPRVFMNFDYYKALWWVHFIEVDCRTLIGTKTGYYHFATVDGLRSFVIRCNVGIWRSLSTVCGLGDAAASTRI